MAVDQANTSDADVESFITRWQGVTASELSTSQTFLIDLCRLLGVDVPHPTLEQDYMFERPLTFEHADGSTSAGGSICTGAAPSCWSRKSSSPARTQADSPRP